MQEAELGARVVAKVRRRLLPIMIICFFIAFLDRANVGLAALTMNKAIGLTPEMYGFGAGLFFIGYVAFEIPSNLILHRIGARIWIARIMVSWGIVATLMAWVQGPVSFNILRFLLGVGEAGFVPGMFFYLSIWFPADARARAAATFVAGSVVSLVIGSPVSTALLAFDGMGGLQGWQWLFILEGMPAIIVGVVVFFYLTDRPEHATWLNEAERAWLQRTQQAEIAAKPAEAQQSAAQALRDPRAVLLSVAIMLNIIAIYGVIMWLPQIVKSAGNLSNGTTGLVTALPYLCTAVAMVINGAHSDRTGERRLHILCWASIGACGFILAAVAHSPYVGLLGICLAAMGLWCSNTVFWTVPMRIFTGVSAAASLALINSVGNVGGFIGPYLTGWIRQSFGSYQPALIVFAILLFGYGLIMFVFLSRTREPATAAA